MIVYVSIGNSDDKLTQSAWCSFVVNIRGILRQIAETIHGEWYSAPDSIYQNACFCVEFRDGPAANLARIRLGDIGSHYGQDAVTWAVATTEFLP